VVACDAEIERTLQAMESRGEPNAPLPELPRAKPHSKSKNQPTFNARAQFARIVGVDLVAVTGLSAATVQTIIAEIGTDVSRFPTAKHVCSWLGLAPHNDISGGKVLRSRIRKVVTPAPQAFRQAAQSVARSDSVYGAFFRSMRARLGPQQAPVATAHTIARTVYHLRKHREVFRPEAATVYDEARRDRELRQLKRRAERLGFTLTPNAEVPAEVAPQTDG